MSGWFHQQLVQYNTHPVASLVDLRITTALKTETVKVFIKLVRCSESSLFHSIITDVGTTLFSLGVREGDILTGQSIDVHMYPAPALWPSTPKGTLFVWLFTEHKMYSQLLVQVC